MTPDEQPSESFEPADFWSLAQGACNGTLTPPDRDRLEAMLRSSAELKKQYVSYLSLHAELQWRFRGTGEPPAVDVPKLPASPILNLTPAADASTPLVNPESGSTSSGLFGWIPTSMIAWAAVLLVLAGGSWISLRTWLAPEGQHARGGLVAEVETPKQSTTVISSATPSSTNAIGRVDRIDSQVIIERDGAKQNAVVGMEILPADSLDVPAGGGVELTLADQSQARLGPRTMLAFASAREAMLREGFVQIDARNRREIAPLAITTPDARTQIQDAWFSMGADRKRTQIRVAEGSVVAARRTDGMEVEIPQGYCSTIAVASDLDPRPSRGGTALLVVASKAMSPMGANWERFNQVLADRIVGDRVWRSGTPVRVRTFEELEAKDLEDCALVVLSVFPLHAGVEEKLNRLELHKLPIPVVCMEPGGFPVLGMTGSEEGVDFGHSRGPLTVDIAVPGHPLAAGYVGESLQLFSYKRYGYWWGKPRNTSIRIAHIHEYPDQWMLFGYEQGDAMVKGTAPARRLGLVIIPISADYDSAVLDIIDAAIDWCLESRSNDVVSLSDDSTKLTTLVPRVDLRPLPAKVNARIHF